MTADRRRTIARPIGLEGIGLHLGQQSRLTFQPAPEGTGVVFRRIDLDGGPEIPARIAHARLTERRTSLGLGAAELHTVEHVLAAIAGARIDDVIIEIDGPEPPILDGSAGPFWDALLEAGTVERATAADYLELPEPVRVIDGESVYEAHPASDLELDVTIDFPHPAIGRQHGEYVITPSSFARDLARARTFGFLTEVETLRGKGLIQGASTANTVVLDESRTIDTVLRWPDEFVRHKALDCLGDLVLVGQRIRARITAFKPSHRGTVTLVREIVKVANRAGEHGGKQGMPDGNAGGGGGGGAVGKHGNGKGAAAVDGPARALNIDELIKIIPHRYPFLMVDRVLSIEEGKRIVGLKNVTINEPFFQGHFPGHPIMPGVLIIEAMAQVGGVLLMGSVEDHQSKVVYFMSLDNVKFRRPVKPGDQLRLELEMTQIRGMVCKMRGVAKVDGEVVAEADMAAIVRDR